MTIAIKRCPLIVLVLISLQVAASADDGAVPPFPDIATPEIWIEGPETDRLGDSPTWPDVAVDNEGRRIHVWTTSGSGLVGEDIVLRLWGPDGSPLTDPAIVNTTNVSSQRLPRVAVSADGSFLVIWQSRELVARGRLGTDRVPEPNGVERLVVRSQAYDANFSPVGGEQLLSTTLPLEATNVYADVAALRTSDGSPGGYAVVWKSNQASDAGDTNDSIEGCLVGMNGVPGSQFRINQSAGGNQNWPTVTELQDGGFLAAWVDGGDVFGRQFNSAGGGVTNDFQISTFAQADAEVLDAAIGWDGRLMVLWEDAGDDAGTSTEIRGRMYDADLAALGPDFRINNLTDGVQDNPRVADFGPRGFLVAWHSNVSSGPDTDQSIEARVVSGPNQFDHSGDGVDDPQVQYNIWDNDNAQNFAGTHGWYGRLATNWRSLTWDGQPPPNNTNDPFIIGRDIEYCLFCDDFEWFSPASPGSLWRWTSTLGLVP